jgi:hypothetical protein
MERLEIITVHFLKINNLLQKKPKFSENKFEQCRHLENLIYLSK